MIENADIVNTEEEKIDDAKHLYLITWSPDPSKLPDCDYTYTHLYSVNLLADYLKYCSCGLFCLEYTQVGNPHYHGWYQVDGEKEQKRIVLVKVLQKFGNLKITQSRGDYKINQYYQRGNCLYYYKKDLANNWQIPKSVITCDTYDDTDWTTKLFFFVNITNRKHVSYLLDVISNKEYYTKFYEKSQ